MQTFQLPAWVRDLSAAIEANLPARARDVPAAIAVGIVWFAGLFFAQSTDYWRPVWVESYYWAGAWLVAAIAGRRVAPRTTFWSVMVLYPLCQRMGLQSDFQLLPMLVAAYGAARAAAMNLPLMIGVTAASTGFLAGGRFIVLPGINVRPMIASSPSSFLAIEALTLGAVAVGVMVNRLQRTTDSLQASNDELRRLQEVRSQQAVLEERTRIARELHDVVAHHVSAIVVRAQAADRVVANQPDAPLEAVRWISGEGKTALAAMRSVVKVLREAPALAPTPSTDAATTAILDAVRRVRDAGRTVTANVPERLGAAPDVELAAARIVQEALTNTLLHSQADTVFVEVTDHQQYLTITVADPGPATDPTGAGEGNGSTGVGQITGNEATGGNGLAHMHERAVQCGGTLTAGSDGTGWRVHAVLPKGQL